MFRRIALIATVAVGSVVAVAQAQEQTDPNVVARQSLMRLNAYNIGVLGSMAQ